MTSNEIRQRFLDFFAKRDHAILDSAPLVPEDDGGGRNTTLFNVAGMQPLMPYLLGQEHPQGKRLASSQMCIRTVDIDEVGDNTHATFFEMLGNWSLGDYFKEEAIQMSYEFLTNQDEGLGLDPKRLYVTVFSGNDAVGQDNEAVEIWKKFIPENRIYYRDGKDNWWTAGPDSPAGPSTEMFYDLTDEGLGDMSPQEFEAADEAQQVVEIWNDVFMAYKQEGGKVVGKLPNKNVDTGSGLERLAAVLQSKSSIFEIDTFMPIIEVLGGQQNRAHRIIADHIKAAVFLAAEGVSPANTDRGYILRRLIRRAVAKMADRIHLMDALIDAVIATYQASYDLKSQRDKIRAIILGEVEKFSKTLHKGMKEFEKGERDAFVLFTTYGFPLEMTQELAHELGEEIDVGDFEKKMKEHQETSRTSAAGKFAGGLADHSQETVRLHTAHHLLLAALQKHVSPDIHQRGSNITADRLRIDFTFGRKLTPEEKETIERQVNKWIEQDLRVIQREMSLQEAQNIGAEMEFGAKYPQTVSVYFIEDGEGNAISKEFCAGPHAPHTRELGVFRIKKEESSSAGVRRIKATLG